ncbi:unnamed protein product, partial [Urochloa humidicola]
PAWPHRTHCPLLGTSASWRLGGAPQPRRHGKSQLRPAAAGAPGCVFVAVAGAAPIPDTRTSHIALAPAPVDVAAAAVAAHRESVREGERRKEAQVSFEIAARCVDVSKRSSRAKMALLMRIANLSVVEETGFVL